MNTKSLARSLGLLALASWLFVPALWAVEAPLVGDTYISSAASSNFGGDVNLIIAPGNAGLVQFDLTTIPASATIAKAYLRVYVNKVVAVGTLNFAAATSAWTEAGVTFPGPAAGAVFASAPVGVANTFLLVDVTSQAQGWLASPATNFGIEITGTGTTSVQLDSKENKATSHPAALELTISGPVGPSGATGAVGPTGAVGLTGAAGVAGAAGAAGLAGALGPAGAVGPTGVAGAQGATGAQGLAGAQGPVGAAGPTGVAGAAGAPGAAGLAGARGPAGASGPIGFSGAAGATGATGPVGATGASGANGPTSNHFSLDTTLHNSLYTIPDTDAFLYYLVNNGLGTSNTCGAVVTLNLPHTATVGAGRMVVASPGNVPNRSDGVQCPGVAFAAQSGDTILPAPISSAHPLVAISDGAGHWIITNSSGS